MLAFAIVGFAVSCKDDDGGLIIPDDDDDDIVTLDDGIYVVGSAIEGDTTEVNLMVEAQVAAPASQTQARPGLNTTYVHIKNGTISFVVVDDGEVTVYGGSWEDKETGSGMGYMLGTVTSGGAAGEITDVGTDGILAQVVFDISTLQYIVIPVQYWQIIGTATDGSWTTGTEIALKSASAGEVVYEGTNIALRGTNTEFKFRVNDNWNLDIDSEECDDAVEPCLNFNTNFGGTLTEIVEGGSNMIFVGGEDVDGAYTVTVTYTPGEGNSLAFSMVRTGDVEPLPEYPEAMYVVGAATSYGWPAADPAENANATMHKIAGEHEGVFWKILHLEAGAGFKLSAAGWGAPNLGFGNITEYDAEGITVSDVDGNMSVSESGIYIVVLDLTNDATKLSIKAAEVYGIGDAFSGWTEDLAANLFTNDVAAKTVTSPVLSADGNIRMYAQHSWIPDWWNAEFRVASGAIEYRNDGGDQEGVAGTAGQVVTLSFDDNTGTID